MDFDDMARRVKRGLRRYRRKLWQQPGAIMFLYGSAIAADGQHWYRCIML
jgi:hypothetical protein